MVTGANHITPMTPTPGTNTSSTAPPTNHQSRIRYRELIKSQIKKNNLNMDPLVEIVQFIGSNISFQTVTSNCQCCGTSMVYGQNALEIKCLTCFTYNKIDQEGIESPIITNTRNVLSYHRLKDIIQRCEGNQQLHGSIYKPVEDLIHDGFSNFHILNKSFIMDPKREASYNSPNLNFNEIKKFYSLLDNLPSKKPMFKLLVAALHSLRHPPSKINTQSINWILIILECPLLYLSISSNCHLSPQFKGISYDIIKRIFGFIAYLDKLTVQNLCHWWSRLPIEEFQIKVDLMNLYITFHLNRLYTHIILQQNGKKTIPLTESAENINYKDHIDMGLFEAINNENSLINELGLPIPGKSTFNNNKKGTFPLKSYQISIGLYSQDWHLKTVSKSMAYLFLANKRHQKIPEANFYNNLVDYVNIKQDFDAWQFVNNTSQHERDCPERLTEDLLKMESKKSYLGINLSVNGSYSTPRLTFCSYPFLISLGSKITILEHEAKRSMGRNAELAFLSSFGEGKIQDVHFKLRVRRSHIVNDSLRQIQTHSKDIKKSLKVIFINEQGIDAGGLKKEWFLLLSRELFDPLRGLFQYSSESGLAFFSICNLPNLNELYFLVGVVVGLAIYNSTILNVKLARVVYNKLMGIKPTLDDFIQLEPTTGNELKKLLKTDNVEKYGLTFEITYKNIFNEYHTVDLIPNGSQIEVNDENKYDYVLKYYTFLLTDIVSIQFQQFYEGFKLVMGTNALSLFTPLEIQLILVGDDNDKKLDIDTLMAITKYNNCTPNDELIQWFWEYCKIIDIKSQRNLLRFVTGSDRVPATGLTSFIFKISLIADVNNTSERLPIAHTCFNEICLYNWGSKERLFSKINLAINESHEFGLK